MPRIYLNSVSLPFFFLTLGAKIECPEETGMKRNSRDDLRALIFETCRWFLVASFCSLCAILTHAQV